MVRIRLRRVGLKKQPSYRIIVADQRSPRDGRFIEIIGHYNPRTNPNTEVVQEERALYWLSTGAQPTDTVKRIFSRTGTWDRYERLRKGESLEALVSEAEAALAQAEPVSPKTNYPSPGAGESRQKAAERAAMAATAVQEEAVQEAEEPVEEVAEVEAEAEVETTAEVEEPAVEEETDEAESDEADA